VKDLGKNFFHHAFDFLASVKLAVFVILALAACLATATVLESLYDTPTARYYIYASGSFYAVLAFLGVNIVCSALSRLPWKRKHLPFLLAHVGIITLLIGSWMTYKYGLDGSLRVAEGESNAAVEMDSGLLVLTEAGKTTTIPVKWVPPGVDFKPIHVQDYGVPYDLTVQEFITHADTNFDFIERPAQAKTAISEPALHIKLVGGAMKIEQDFWLWTGDPGWAAYAAGPAWLEFKHAEGAAGAVARDAASPSAIPPASAPPGSPVLTFKAESDGSLSFVARSSSGERVAGHLSAREIAAGKSIDPHWRGGVRIDVLKLLPDAWVSTNFKPSRTQYGDLAPPSAIHVVAGQGKDQADVWLGIGSRAILRASGHEVEIGYFHRRVILPFGIHLNHFDVQYYQGSLKPASYSSLVSVDGDSSKQNQTISMNHPLKQNGITLYQASYEDAMPRPTVSIFAVNRDPGRMIKYLGSLLIVLGVILLFANKYLNKPKPKASSGVTS
jgi:hypothetical protein